VADPLPLSPDDVSEIISILSGSGYDQLEITTARFRLRVRREGGGWSQEWNWPESSQPAAAGVAGTITDAVPAAAGRTADAGLMIRTPLPGIFYRAPQPGAPPFVEIGGPVEKNTVVGIVETMKLMTPVHAGVAGVIEAIVVDNATMVDTGAVLMRVRPAA